jgi:catechol 2,3-dioxygenase-like lactoylglutathione lyase family enzyme
MSEVASIVLLSDHLDETVAFYRSLGVPLEEEDHGGGVMHAAGELNGLHLAVLACRGASPSPTWRSGGSTFVGFWVQSLEEVVAALQVTGAEVLAGHERREWGCRVVLLDPDGRAVEINQRDHCPVPA